MNDDVQIHLIKLAAGAGSLSELEARQKSCGFTHVTRRKPKRAAELLAGGSLYWVIKGVVRARQEILDLCTTSIGEVEHCKIVLSPDIRQTSPRPQRAFQGWRYLEFAAKPSDFDGDARHLDASWMREMVEHGLI